MVETLILIIAGIFSGVVSGATGASGVMIMIPFLTTFFGFPLYVAVGTSLLADLISSVPISYTYFRNRNVDVFTGLLLGGGAILGTTLAVGNLQIFPEELIVFGIALFMVGLGFRLWRDGVKKEYRPESFPEFKIFKDARVRMITSVIVGVFLGFLTGYFGAGGGILIFLVLYFLLRLNLKKSIGTAAFVMIVSSLSGVIGHGSLGNINVSAGLIIGCSAAIGGVLSAILANRLDEAYLSKIVGGIFVVLAVIMLGVRLVS